MEIYKLPDKKIKIIVLKKLSELQEYTKTTHEIRKTIHEQNEKFNKETDAIKKNKIEIQELKNFTENYNSRLNQAERISELEERSPEITERYRKKKKD